MRDLFPGWIPPDEATLERYWNEATFAVDASVLLDLYRFSEEARTRLLSALRSFGDRLWIPHQVVLEFHQNRFNVLLAQREAEGNLLAGLDQIRDELHEQLGKRLKGAGRRDLAPLQGAIDEGFEQLRTNLKEAEKAHTQGLGESITEDPVYEEVESLCRDRMGSPFTPERQREVLADAQKRFRIKTPPGYLDIDKPDDRKYGDVVLWYQLCEKAQMIGKPVVLVSDDQKEDWMWRVKGKTLGPRPELVAEMREKATVGFHIYTPTRLLQVWEQREQGREVEPDVLAEFEASEHDPAPARYLLNAVRRYFDTAGEQAGDGEGWMSLGAHLVQGRAFHFVDAGSVTMELEFKVALGRMGPFPAFVTISLPDGSETISQVYPISISTEGTAQVFGYSIKYPGHFGQAAVLIPGSYEVRWDVAENADQPGGPLQKVAGDQFTIRASSESPGSA
jgi:PIN like domain